MDSYHQEQEVLFSRGALTPCIYSITFNIRHCPIARVVFRNTFDGERERFSMLVPEEFRLTLDHSQPPVVALWVKDWLEQEFLFFSLKKKKALNAINPIGSFQKESYLYRYISLKVIKIYLKYLLKENYIPSLQTYFRFRFPNSGNLENNSRIFL